MQLQMRCCADFRLPDLSGAEEERTGLQAAGWSQSIDAPPTEIRSPRLRPLQNQTVDSSKLVKPGLSGSFTTKGEEGDGVEDRDLHSPIHPLTSP